MRTKTDEVCARGGNLLPAHAEKHIEFLDHVRGVAILLVFIFHGLLPAFGHDQLGWGGWVRSFSAPASFLAVLPATLGHIGVAIFFVVSGFCIHLSYERSSRNGYRDFFLRRFFRIYPVYVAALLLFALLDPSTRVDFSASRGVLQFFSHLFLFHNFLDYRYFVGINGAFWSIAVEVQLYLIYPVLRWMVRRWGWAGALWITGTMELTLRGVCGAFDIQQTASWTWLFRLPFSFWFSWTLGALLADQMLNRRPLCLARFPVSVWLGLMLVCWYVKPLFWFVFPVAALATTNVTAFLLTRPDVKPGLPRFVMEHIRLAGVMSYSIYLLHQPLLMRVPHLLEKFLPGLHFPPLAVYGICVLSWFLILIPCWLLHRYGEVPSIDFGKWFIKKLAVGRLAGLSGEVVTATVFRRLREWNPLHSYLKWGVIFAILGTLISLASGLLLAIAVFVREVLLDN